MNLAPTTASLKRPEKGFKMRYVSLLIALFAVLNNLYSMSTECARLFSKWRNLNTAGRERVEVVILFLVSWPFQILVPGVKDSVICFMTISLF